MVLECADGPFGPIASVDMRWYQLIFAVVGRDCVEESFACFIVKDVDVWGCVMVLEASIHVVVSYDPVGVML